MKLLFNGFSPSALDVTGPFGGSSPGLIVSAFLWILLIVVIVVTTVIAVKLIRKKKNSGGETGQDEKIE